jgi:hypothetical protein
MTNSVLSTVPATRTSRWVERVEEKQLGVESRGKTAA